MATPAFKHTDNDGDKLLVQQGLLSAVFTATDGDTGQVVQVAVRTEYLPALIAKLQAMQWELQR